MTENDTVARKPSNIHELRIVQDSSQKAYIFTKCILQQQMSFRQQLPYDFLCVSNLNHPKYIFVRNFKKQTRCRTKTCEIF